ncbi:HAD family hydrolase [Tessaracoccus aquimaris]|uniref:HAD family hydrolase n=1 Tax=Tessaracoccus aquimaris TaxID=1332264 RepID=A0A1Q2CQF5_9ACTN|nr:HAD family phosphatase [Tessaracoccus aquimaris]AQP48359.1 HAD family hydrolase [Tessaracoccus aquimaris]
MSTPGFSAVLFDCDGILVNSEPITNSVLREMLHELGWEISEEDCIRHFVGTSFIDEWEIIHEHTGYRIDHDWILGFRERRNAALVARLEPVAGAVDAVRSIAERFPVACVSGADRGKIDMQLAMAGLTEVFGDRVFSGMELPRSKPAPDVYLAAASAMGIDPTTAAVVEDSSSGVRAGVAAGATVFGYAPGEPTYLSPDELTALGAAAVFDSMDALPGLVSVGRPAA